MRPENQHFVNTDYYEGKNAIQADRYKKAQTPKVRGQLLGLPKKKKKVQPIEATTLETEREFIPDEITMPKDYFNPTIFNNPGDIKKQALKLKEFKAKSYVLDGMLAQKFKQIELLQERFEQTKCLKNEIRKEALNFELENLKLETAILIAEQEVHELKDKVELQNLTKLEEDSTLRQ